MPRICAVSTCKSPQGKDITYFRFPVKKDPERASKWTALCVRTKPINVEAATICSNHFATDAYKRDLQVN